MNHNNLNFRNTQIALVISLAVLSACGKDAPADNMVDPLNIEDFGTEAIPRANVFDVHNAAEWNTATAVIGSSGNNRNYVINVLDNFSLEGTYASTFGIATGIKVSIRGEKKISLNSNGCLLVIYTNQTVISRETTFEGKDENELPLVLIMRGELIMRSGEFSGNSAGGIDIRGGSFTMNGGKISGNSAITSGGVSVLSGSFTMNGGDIRENTATNAGSAGGGGGVSVLSGSFTMNGGRISGNTSKPGGGGVLVFGGSFTMNSGEIRENTATGRGGGGVCVLEGSFTMNGGEISGNTANFGGGVSLYDYTFSKTGLSVICGNSSKTHVDGSDNNTATSADSGSGHAVYVGLYPNSGKFRDAAAEAGVDMYYNSDTDYAGFEN
ncbi:hypothetical protein FACS1894159_07530 [Bacteroidia bacterium]|nr:hypothetical protein FACS1894159_07530 [Bacteroidia bacterium]